MRGGEDMVTQARKISELSWKVSEEHQRAGTLPTNHLEGRVDGYSLRARRVLEDYRGGRDVRWQELVELMVLADLSIQEAAETYINYDARRV